MWKLTGEEQRIADADGVSGHGFVGVYLDDVHSLEVRDIEPRRVREHLPITDIGGCGLEVQSAWDRYGDYVVAVRLKRCLQLLEPFLVGAGGGADEDRSFCDAHIATFKRAGRLDADEFTVRPNGRDDAVNFTASRFGSGSGQDSQLAYYDDDVLDEDGIGVLMQRIEFDDRDAHVLQCLDVCLMLPLRGVIIDLAAVQMGQFAVLDGAADRAGDGVQHEFRMVTGRPAPPRHLVIWHNCDMTTTWKAAAVAAIGTILATGGVSGGGDGGILTSRDQAVNPDVPIEDDAFLFAVYGDRTGGPAEGIEILRQAVAETNLIDPDLVMTVGDLVQGYNTRPVWMQQMSEYREVMSELNCPWFPVAGNHDIYWRGPGRPPGEHEGDFESFFGPLWYAFDHKGCRFIVLYTDEGDPATGVRTFSKPASQVMSDAQKVWLQSVLKSAGQMRHIFVFCHHPRWRGGRYGDDWEQVHKMFVDAGNVTAVIAGHVHQLQHDGEQDGIEYMTLATVGGGIRGDAAAAGFFHHVNLVMVRDDGVAMATVPVGSVVDPRAMTVSHIADVEALIAGGPEAAEVLTVSADGVVSATVPVRLQNPSDAVVTWTVAASNTDSRWSIRPDHLHEILRPGEAIEIPFELHHPGPLDAIWSIPSLTATATFSDVAGSWEIPNLDHSFEVVASGLPKPTGRGALRTAGGTDAAVIPSDAIPLDDGPLTLEAWVLPDDLAGRRGVVAKTEGSEYGLFASDWHPSFYVFLDGAYREIKSERQLEPERWQHLAGVYDGAEVRLYVDGLLVGRAEASGLRKRNPHPLIVGGDVDGNGRANSGMSGVLDEVRLSSAARYAGSEITPPTRHVEDADTLLLLHFDGASGPFIRDASGRGADGRLVGAAIVDESISRE